MTVNYSEFAENKTIELYVSGKVTKEDFHRVAGQFEAFIQDQGTVKLLEVVENFTGFDPSTLWDGIKFDIKHLKHISHCAVVSDISWMSPFAKAAGAFMSTKLRTFNLSQVEDARVWLNNPDLAE